MSIKLTTTQFIEKARNIHGNKYDYSKVEYINSQTKVCIICNECGNEFWQIPSSHLRGSGCKNCFKIKIRKLRKKSQEQFIKEINEIYEKKYDTSFVEYINDHTKVKLICHKKDKNGIEHGEFNITPNSLLNGESCPKCGYETTQEYNKKINEKCKNEFKNRIDELYNKQYDLSKVEYINANQKVCVICHEKDKNGIEHGEFWQTPSKLLNGHACKKCANERRRKKLSDTMDNFIKKAQLIHGKTYIYFPDAVYINNHTVVPIKCKKHGIFLQKPNLHLNGCGCPYCKETILERNISIILANNNIKYIYEASKKDGLDWLGLQSLDFYLPDYNVAIECQGEQHFKPIDFFGGEEKFKETKKLDLKKYKLCKEHKIDILYYADNKPLEKYIDTVYNKEELIKKIINYDKKNNIIG